eukprot:NODE_1794_length_736_cov_92.773399_g1744_i0.p2 GENE.NODE_1794_length_736_cov_92.773399_g1744_i0~~NODE_1794_length_736_cov_92.773399_g1744_i0.p2  ORF type:complete len:105 (-),score=7.55 NODE_1794_length_736_cov_92.773399_g1744_i0:128-442(-)
MAAVPRVRQSDNEPSDNDSGRNGSSTGTTDADVIFWFESTLRGRDWKDTIATKGWDIWRNPTAAHTEELETLSGIQKLTPMRTLSADSCSQMQLHLHKISAVQH